LNVAWARDIKRPAEIVAGIFISEIVAKLTK